MTTIYLSSVHSLRDSFVKKIVPSTAILREEVDVVFCLGNVKEFENIFVWQLLHDINLSTQRVYEEFFDFLFRFASVDPLDNFLFGDHLTGFQIWVFGVVAKINFAIRTPTKNSRFYLVATVDYFQCLHRKSKLNIMCTHKRVIISNNYRSKNELVWELLPYESNCHDIVRVWQCDNR